VAKSFLSLRLGPNRLDTALLDADLNPLGYLSPAEFETIQATPAPSAPANLPRVALSR
jgi:hypothetical protein